MIKPYTTERGFDGIQFIDRYGATCTLQISSIADKQGHVWFGVNESGLTVHLPDTGVSHGTPFWQNLSQVLPEGTEIVGTRMHLNQDMVRALLPALTYFAEHGGLPDEEETD